MLLETRKTAIFIRKESEKNRRIMSSHNTNTYNNLLCLSTTTTLTTTTYIYRRTYQQKETYILSLLGRNKTNTKLESHCSTTSGILLRECSLYVCVCSGSAADVGSRFISNADPRYLPPLESVKDFLIKLDMKPCMHLVELSIFSLNHVIVRPTKIIKDLYKAST